MLALGLILWVYRGRKMNPDCPESLLYAPVAQWIERWIPNPCAASSILAGGTNILTGFQVSIPAILFHFVLPT